MHYLCQIWNDVYGYWDADEMFDSPAAAWEYLRTWRGWGWKVRYTRTRVV